MKITVTKHTEVKLTRKELDDIVAKRISILCPDLDKITVTYNVDIEGHILGASVYSSEKGE